MSKPLFIPTKPSYDSDLVYTYPPTQYPWNRKIKIVIVSPEANREPIVLKVYSCFGHLKATIDSIIIGDKTRQVNVTIGYSMMGSSEYIPCDLVYEITNKSLPEHCCLYACWSCKRIPELEEIILQDLHFAFEYSYKIIQTRWPELEQKFKKVIQNDPRWLGIIKDYVIYIAKKRMPEFEPMILEDIEYATEYHRNLIKSQWSELEEVFKSKYKATTPGEGDNYLCACIVRYLTATNKRIPELEKIILEVDTQYAIYHCTNFRIRWPELEEKLLKQLGHGQLCRYGGRQILEYLKLIRSCGYHWEEGERIGNKIEKQFLERKITDKNISMQIIDDESKLQTI